jgi:hypothetical protein
LKKKYFEKIVSFEKKNFFSKKEYCFFQKEDYFFQKEDYSGISEYQKISQ